MIKEVLGKYEMQHKVAMLVTDDAANMALARRLVVESAGYQHLLQMRCVAECRVKEFVCFMRCLAVHCVQRCKQHVVCLSFGGWQVVGCVCAL